MNLGRYRSGQTVTLFLTTENPAAAAALPDAAPSFSVFGPTGTKLLTAAMPLWGASLAPTFHYPLFLDATFVAGRHLLTYHYNNAGFFGLEEDEFEVAPGGNPQGAALAMHFFHRPEADFVLQQKESGLVVRGKNPSA